MKARADPTEGVVEVTDADGHWAGFVDAGPGWLAFTGGIGSASPHAHAAVQVLSLTRGTVDVADEHGDSRTTRSVVVPAGAEHALRASADAWGTITYLEPTSRAAGPAARAGTRLADWPEVAEPVAAPNVPHPAVAGVLDRARELAAGRLRLADAAASVHVSPSRLRHLFTEQLGVGFAAWRRWLRLQLALAAVADGASLTRAAHVAGFTDSAHLTRSCKAMFGLTPTAAIAGLDVSRLVQAAP